jgi:hypothetical protein
LRALAHVARAAAAAGHPLPLQRLVLANGVLLQPLFCSHTLAGLFMALPQLQHLHLELVASEEFEGDGDSYTGHAAACAALAPLRHLTALTSLHLETQYEVDEWGERDSGGLAAEQLACLPDSLVRLDFYPSLGTYGHKLAFDRLTALTTLRVGTFPGWVDDLPQQEGFTQLHQLRSLALDGFCGEAEWLQEHCEVLQYYRPGVYADGLEEALSQLVNLRSLDLREFPGLGIEQTLEGYIRAAAPHLTQLRLALPSTPAPPPAEPAAAERAWWWREDAMELLVLAGMTRLRALHLDAPRWCTALPVGLPGMVHLTRLHIRVDHSPPAVTCAWVCAVQGLVNLQVLTVPAVWASCWHNWLLGLTKLGVLEVWESISVARLDDHGRDEAAAHLECLAWASLGPARNPTQGHPAAASAAGTTSSSSSSSSRCLGQLQLLCTAARQRHGYDPCCEMYRQLKRLLRQDLALFSGPLKSFLRVGWQLWPAPKAERLQQLLGDML